MLEIRSSRENLPMSEDNEDASLVSDRISTRKLGEGRKVIGWNLADLTLCPT